jgi:hypothetical protein
MCWCTRALLSHLSKIWSPNVIVVRMVRHRDGAVDLAVCDVLGSDVMVGSLQVDRLALHGCCHAKRRRDHVISCEFFRMPAWLLHASLQSGGALQLMMTAGSANWNCCRGSHRCLCMFSCASMLSRLHDSSTLVFITGRGAVFPGLLEQASSDGFD